MADDTESDNEKKGPWGPWGHSSGQDQKSSKKEESKHNPWGSGRDSGDGLNMGNVFEGLFSNKNKKQKTNQRGGSGPGGGGFDAFQIPSLTPRTMVWIALGVCALWLSTGFYRVQPDQQGVVLRFGKWVRTDNPGLNYHLPAPIESVELPSVTRINRVSIGFQGSPRGDGDIRQVPEESLMLTGDENIVDISFTVFWRIKDAGHYLFAIRAPEETVKSVAESAMREVVGQTKIAEALAEGRSKIENHVRTLLQQMMDQYGAGIDVTEVQLQRVDPPAEVIDAFRDVQRARADLERLRNDAEAYRNKIIPEARGDAERTILDAEAYKASVIAKASGQASRFAAVVDAYQKAPEVVQKRLYLETMEDVMGRANKVVLGRGMDGQGVLPYLPLPEFKTKAPATQGDQQ